jgi:carboxymethylenebutenolidase
VKWAEEGYAVVQIEAAAFEGNGSGVVLKEAIDALKQCEKCDLNDKVGLVCKLSLMRVPLLIHAF